MKGRMTPSGAVTIRCLGLNSWRFGKAARFRRPR
ncbi:hypothetical protein chiPu_0027209, partial [Chiloscyllium punctatum]|nr:hypothetical protein [Chiloscyllium punctatum]